MAELGGAGLADACKDAREGAGEQRRAWRTGQRRSRCGREPAGGGAVRAADGGRR